MVENLTSLWQDFNLSEGESVEVIVQQQAFEEVVLRGNLCLVGKLIADRIIGKDTLRKTLVRLWKQWEQHFSRCWGIIYFWLILSILGIRVGC